MRTHTLLRAGLVLVAASMAAAQSLTDLPNLSTASLPAASSSAATSSSATSDSSTASSATSTSGASTTTGSSSIFIVSLSALPTIAGAGIPTMVIPYTAAAPFMQHSNLPEGTVFIAVGAVLAFLGACVLLWRGLVAWSINRSVKRAAMASIRGGSEKPSTNWGGSTTKSSVYKDVGNSMSMEALTSAGKPIKSHFKDQDTGRSTPPPPPANLFFSPTAHARSDGLRPLAETGTRNSSYLPAGYYAAPSSHAAGGARNTVIGGQLPPYARSSMVDPSPPASPSLRPSTSDHLRAPASRDGMRQSLYNQPSGSSLGVNARASNDGLGGSRAPSAYLDDLFENHTAMASRDHI